MCYSVLFNMLPLTKLKLCKQIPSYQATKIIQCTVAADKHIVGYCLPKNFYL